MDFSPLIGVVMCSHEHLCVVAVPTASCFQYVCPLSYFYSIGVLQLVAATICVLSALLTLLHSSLSVLCVCTLPYSNNYYCYHYLLYHWLLPIMPVLVDFLLLLEFLCAVMNTGVLSHCQPHIVFQYVCHLSYI